MFTRDIAKANNYGLVDVLYLDNIKIRMGRPIEVTPFDWGTLPIQLLDMTDTTALMTKAAIPRHLGLKQPHAFGRKVSD
jgi:hypothetical protein